ncbi:MAG: prepilin-type N-terminal cleavage/methylation domain-containing protein [Candidatus Riflebacteria bacterium]|nr:prepilin-type N-terminal cleavage/methylation domain-containing protein [Candidatus Riflebacteria bacterium]
MNTFRWGHTARILRLHSPKSTVHGFSFVELIMAMAIIAVTLGPMLWFINRSHLATRMSVNEVIATNAASELMEAIQTLPVDLLAPIDESTPASAQQGDLIRDGAIQGTFQTLVFGKALEKGFFIKIPTLPKGWNCYIIIKPMATQSNVPANSTTSLVDRAAYARQIILISIQITWLDRGVPKKITLKTVRSRV